MTCTKLLNCMKCEVSVAVQPAAIAGTARATRSLFDVNGGYGFSLEGLAPVHTLYSVE